MNSRKVITIGIIYFILVILNSSVIGQKQSTLIVNSNAFIYYDSKTVGSLFGIGLHFQKNIWTNNRIKSIIDIGFGINSESSETMLFDKYGMTSIIVSFNKSHNIFYSGFGIFNSFLMPTMVNYTIGYQRLINKALVLNISIDQPLWFSYQYQIQENFAKKVNHVWLWESVGNLNTINIGIGLNL